MIGFTVAPQYKKKIRRKLMQKDVLKLTNGQSDLFLLPRQAVKIEEVKSSLSLPIID